MIRYKTRKKDEDRQEGDKIQDNKIDKINEKGKPKGQQRDNRDEEIYNTSQQR